MYDNVIKLVKESSKTNEYGDMVAEKTERTVFAELRSIGQSEFYQAQAVGLKPEIKFVLADYLDYQGEDILKYQAYNEAKENEYTIIRTYRANNQLEMICKRGVN